MGYVSTKGETCTPRWGPFPRCRRRSRHFSSPKEKFHVSNSRNAEKSKTAGPQQIEFPKFGPPGRKGGNPAPGPGAKNPPTPLFFKRPKGKNPAGKNFLGAGRRAKAPHPIFLFFLGLSSPFKGGVGGFRPKTNPKKHPQIVKKN